MKKSIIYLVAAVLPLICASCAKKNVIAGHLDGLDGDSLRVEIYDVTNQRTPINTIDVLAKGGNFSCEIPETEVRGLLLIDPVSGLRTPLVFVPGEYAKIGGSLDSLVVLGGSAFYKDQNEYETICNEDKLKLREIVAEYQALPSTATDAAKDAVMAKYDAVNDHIASLTKDFITRKPASLFCATLVNHLVGDDGKDALDVLALIPDDVKQERYDRLYTLAQRISLERGRKRVGTVVPVITEDVSEDGIFYIGRSYAEAPDSDGKIYFTSEEPLAQGDIAKVEILIAEEYDLTGRAVGEPT